MTFVPKKDLVSQSSESGSSYASTPTTDAGAIRDGLRGKYVCPFCGSVNDSEQGMCPRCTMENSAATRKATKTRIGPWYVLQTRNPAAPGMTWETLLSFVRKGRVKPRSILRGPTTHQLWRFAAQVKGLSREFGICYSCGSGIETTAALCPTCNRLQDPPPNPDALLEASRDAQSPNYTTPPATIDGSVLAAAGPATVVGQVSSGSLAAIPASAIGPAVNEGDFVIPALGSGGAGATTAAASQSTAVGTFSPQAISGLTPASAGPGTRQSTVPPPAAKAAPAVSGISGDASWARIPATPRERPAPRSTPRPSVTTPPPAGPAFNPYADDDAPGRRNDAEGFLSAKDLAAAFNLGFVGEEDEAPVQRTVRQPPNPAAARNPMNATGATSGAYPPEARRKRLGVFKGLLLMLFLAAVGYGVALVLSPELLEQTKVFVSEKYHTVLEKLNSEAEGDKLGDQPRVTSTPPRPTPPKPATLPGDNERYVEPIEPKNGNPPATKPASQRAATPSATMPNASNAWVGSPVQKLYAEALDLEETDPKSALGKYKQIKTNFSSEIWPTDLESRIQRLESANKPGADPGL